MQLHNRASDTAVQPTLSNIFANSMLFLKMLYPMFQGARGSSLMKKNQKSKIPLSVWVFSEDPDLSLYRIRHNPRSSRFQIECLLKNYGPRCNVLYGYNSRWIDTLDGSKSIRNSDLVC
jgi:hypothetical protein